MSIGSPAAQWIACGGGLRPLLIPHSIDAEPSGAMPYPQTMLAEGVLKAPFRGAASLSVYECLALRTNPFHSR